MSNPTNHICNNTQDDVTITADNRRSTEPGYNMANHIQDENIPPTSITMGIFDSGATGHFLQDNAPVTNKRVAQNPIHITLLDGNKIKSTHA
jgi:hypothetical protein